MLVLIYVISTKEMVNMIGLNLFHNIVHRYIIEVFDD